MMSPPASSSLASRAPQPSSMIFPSRNRLFSTPCRLPSDSSEPCLNDNEADCPKRSLRQKLSWTDSETNHHPKFIGIFGRIFAKSSNKTFKSSGGPWEMLELGGCEPGLPPAYDQIDLEGRQSTFSPLHHQTESRPSERPSPPRVENRTTETSSRADVPRATPSAIRSSAEQGPSKKPSYRSGSHSISITRRARQARRDLNAAKKSLPVLGKYARTATAQRR